MLTFRRLDIIIAQIACPPDGVSRVLCCWEIVPQYSNLDATTFVVERSLSNQFSEGEYEQISGEIQAGPGIYVYEFDDITANLSNFWRKYFYRIKAINPYDGTIVSSIRSWETNPRPHELAIIERHDFVLQYLQGTPSFAFVERTAGGARCSCYDVTTGRTTSSNCDLCLGTGRQQPYFDPIPMFVDFNPDEQLVSISSFGELQTKEKDCWFSAYPVMKPGDLIYEVMTAVLWRIARINTIQPMGTTIQQVCRLNALERSEVVYQGLVPRISDDTLRSTVQEWERIKEERLF